MTSPPVVSENYLAMQIGNFRRGWFWNSIHAVLCGIILYILGLWCIVSLDVPAPAWALPLPQRFLSGLAFMLVNPLVLPPVSLIFTITISLFSRRGRGPFTIAALLGFAFFLAGAFWVPNSFVLWPNDILGNHTLPELIREIFAFHLVPAPAMNLSSSDSVDALFRWQIEEFTVRLCVLITLWIVCLIAAWKLLGRVAIKWAPAIVYDRL